MCGIVGFVGGEAALPVLIEGLKRLEYRGYDSAGLAFFNDGFLQITKKQGRIKNLEHALSQDGQLDASANHRIGIGHTRWATHGAPSDINAHPHLSEDGRFAVVHNGIIENEEDLRGFLIRQGVIFRSETDSEVIVHLIAWHARQAGPGQHWRQAVQMAVNDLAGSYALGVLCRDDPESMIVVRRDSPLIIGLGDHWQMAASDIPAVLHRTRRVVILQDGDMAELSADNYQIYDAFGQRVERKEDWIDWDAEAAEKGGFEHFMIKEIHEEPQAVRQTLAPRYQQGHLTLRELNIDPEWLNQLQQIVIVACGTAYHAGMVGQRLIETCCRRPVVVDIASEFRYRDPLINDKTLVVMISQSGETLDTLAAMREAKSRGATTLAIVNVIGSSIAREADHVFYTHAGPEIAVASTKAYTTQLTALYLLTFYLAGIWQTLPPEVLQHYEEELLRIPDRLAVTLDHKEQLQRFAAEHFNVHSVFFLGRNLDYALAMEASLKLKEISYIHSEAYAGGELKHGTIALIEEGTLVICPITQPQLLDKTISNIREVKTRGATVMGIISPACLRAASVCDTVIEIPDSDPLLAPILAMTPAQLFAYYVSVLKGLDVDKPRNLAKSVTVE